MIKKWKIIAVILMTFAFIPAANAFGFLFVWLGATPALATALEASVYLHAGAYYAYDLFFAEKGADGKAAGSPVLTAKLSPTAARSNPDPTKFDDPAPGARDVTPKPVVPSGGSAVPPPDPALSADQCYTFTGAECSGTQAGVATLMTLSGNGDDPVTCGGYTTAYSYDGANIRYARTFTAGGCGYPAGYVENGLLGAPFVTTGTRNDVPSTSCPAGYVTSVDGCTLSNPAAVKKPTTTPCEVIRTATGLQTDAANPNCDGINVSGNTLQATSDTAVSFNADGSVSVSNPGGQTTFQMSGPNPDGSMTITGASRSGNPGAYVPGSTVGTSPTTACGGVGQPACSGTAGSTAGASGSCGGVGQPACSINDSGFDGLADPGAAGRSAFDAASAERDGSIANQTDTSSGLGLSFDWVPKPQFSQACEPIVINFMRSQISWNFCQYLPMLSEAMGYLFYIFSGLYIWQSFMRSRVGGC